MFFSELAKQITYKKSDTFLKSFHQYVYDCVLQRICVIWLFCVFKISYDRKTTEYWLNDYKPKTIPAPEWINGCPKTRIVCCPENQEFKEKCYSEFNVIM